MTIEAREINFRGELATEYLIDGVSQGILTASVGKCGTSTGVFRRCLSTRPIRELWPDAEIIFTRRLCGIHPLV